ncbi:MAG: exodeoxyribonuclease V subunit gamma [Synechococcaceae cyanobacterium]|nr:exodeoxyribonuclease V subunit gamma [Synechococcaceae cyanobacterium]
MLTVYRSNRAEWLAELLALQLQLDPPDPFLSVAVVVNTWPTSRWLSEQLAPPLGGISANLRFPFPGAALRALVERLLEALPDPTPAEASSRAAEVQPGPAAPGGDPWRAPQLVWPLLELLPRLCAELEASEGGAMLRSWCDPAAGPGPVSLQLWQMARAIADAFDDYALYRPGMLQVWQQGRSEDDRGDPLPTSQRWQCALYGLLRQRLGCDPFGLRVSTAIARLRQAASLPEAVLAPLGGQLRLFGISSMAPVQVRLLEALARHSPVTLYLLTPCEDLWQRCGERRLARRDALTGSLEIDPSLEQEWLLKAPGLEARFGRLGSEFQQLLEGCDGVSEGQGSGGSLFCAAASLQRQPQDDAAAAPDAAAGTAPLLAQLQQQLADPQQWPRLSLDAADRSLEFHACPGPLRQVQVVRDRLLQLLAADPSLEPRDILVMTPDVDRFAPLVAAVFSDSDATGVSLPWRITDRSQQDAPGISRGLLQLLTLASERLTASGLERLLQCRPLLENLGLSSEEGAALSPLLQQAGFRWGLDGRERGGDPTHSLRWTRDRLLLGLVLPATPGLAPADTAPFPCGVPLETLGRWLQLLQRLSHWLELLRQPVSAAAWQSRLQTLLSDLFGDGGEAAWELPPLLGALDACCASVGEDLPPLEAGVLAAVLEEQLSVDSGRFGHRSGALTLSALEPMRAIPHRVIVLLGLDAGGFPRQSQRPGFHLMDQRRRLGDPNSADQDRYVLLEALLSARDHLLISWSCRDDRTGNPLEPASPVRQWLQWLEGELPPGQGDRLLHSHPANPLDPAAFQPDAHGRPPASCDRRLLRTLQQLCSAPPDAALALVDRPMPPSPEPVPEAHAPDGREPLPRFEEVSAWLREPQRQWLLELGLRPSEWEQRLDDLERLILAETQRSALLRQQLIASPDRRNADDSVWLEHCRGQGLLPPRAAAALEARLLEQRWSSLQAVLAGLGPRQERALHWRDWLVPSLWYGDCLVQVHPARLKPSLAMELWLALLLACGGGQAPRRALLIARDGAELKPLLELRPPEPATADAELQRLLQLRREWLGRCWPVPPRSGWAFLEGEQKRAGQGWSLAGQTWEGGAYLQAERRQAEMVLCFGADRPAASLLDDRFAERAAALYGPLREAIA